MRHKWKKVNKYITRSSAMTTEALCDSNIKEVKQCIFCKILKKKHQYKNMACGNRYTTKYYYQDNTLIGVIAPECKREEFIKEEEFII